METPFRERRWHQKQCFYADIYQVYSYAHHFNCDTNILLYPSMGSSIKQRYQLAASPDKALLINQIDFDVDLLTESRNLFERLKAIIEAGLLKKHEHVGYDARL